MWYSLLDPIVQFSAFSLLPLKYKPKIRRSTLKMIFCQKRNEMVVLISGKKTHTFIFPPNLMTTREMKSHSLSQTIKHDFFFFYAFCQQCQHFELLLNAVIVNRAKTRLLLLSHYTINCLDRETAATRLQCSCSQSLPWLKWVGHVHKAKSRLWPQQSVKGFISAMRAVIYSVSRTELQLMICIFCSTRKPQIQTQTPFFKVTKKWRT